MDPAFAKVSFDYASIDIRILNFIPRRDHSSAKWFAGRTEIRLCGLTKCHYFMALYLDIASS